ncbi:MAG: hypothetical protein GY950_24780 [bacterium]|nr:hypothetical protein [bacterium]
MTEKLYYTDIDKIEFEARILEVAETTEKKKKWRLTLDKTCFYPEGGGQPADKGRINNIPVIDVQKKDDTILHFMPQHPGTGTAKGQIDTQWRKDFMQQHTGQHIVSGALWKIGGYKTVSVHMGIDYTTIEIETPDIPENDLIKTEKLANQIINDNLPINAVYTNHHELDKFPLRKPTAHQGNIRLVRIGDFDCVGCGGLHLDSTRKVELVKAVAVEKIRANTRISWKIGARAFDDYRKKDKIIRELKTVLATNEEMFAQKAEELKEEIINQKKKNNRLENRLAETIAQNLYNERKTPPRSGFAVIAQSLQAEDDYLVKKIMKILVKKENLLVCLVNVLPEKLQWSIGCSDDVTFPFDDLKSRLLPVIDGKGGGRHPLWQGTGRDPEKAAEFLSTFGTLSR